MVFFIFILVLMFALSGVLYLMVRALPRVAEIDGVTSTGGEGAANAVVRHGILDRWAHSNIPEKIDAAFNEWFLKFLRKFKVFTLKLDNMITGRLHKIRREHAETEKKAAIDFKEISGQNKGDEK
jgi:hypothetical protein